MNDDLRKLQRDKEFQKQFAQEGAFVEGVVLIIMAGLGLYFGRQLELTVMWLPCALFFAYLLYNVIGGFIDGVSQDTKKNSQP